MAGLQKAAAKAASSITQMLTTPGKVAHSLDWRKASGSILSLRIVRDRIDLAVASHPSLEEPTMELPSIPLRTHIEHNKKVLDEAVSQELARAVQNFNVCGMVVSWPVQREGWCGKSCGKVLNTLDQIQAANTSRPICLYDPNHSSPPEDEWGRATLYSETSDKTLHVASEEQYEDTTGKVAVDIWNDFCAEHWPELCEAQRSLSAVPPRKSSDYRSGSHNSDFGFEEEQGSGMLMQAAF